MTPSPLDRPTAPSDLDETRQEPAGGARALRIREADDQDAERWNRYIAGASESNFYQRYEWQRVNREALGHRTISLVAERGDEIVGVLPLTHVESRLFGSILSSMPFVNLGGAAAADEQTVDALVRHACGVADEAVVDYMEIRAKRELAGLPTVSNKVSMTVPLDGGADAVWDAFKSKHRSNIKRAMKNDLEVRAGAADLLDAFYGLMEKSWKGLGTPLYAKSYFRAVLDRLGADIRIFVVFKDGTPIGTALNGHFQGTVEGMWAAGDPEYRDLQSNYVLYWEMIRDAAERGFQRFHLGRSTVGSGAARYKARWNAYPEPLYWNYHLVNAEELPALNPDNPRYALAIRAWQRLPLPVTRLLGPRLARLIP